MARQKKKSVSKKSNIDKPIGLVTIPKKNNLKLKSGVAFVYGTKTKPKFKKKRFKTKTQATKYAIKKGFI